MFEDNKWRVCDADQLNSDVYELYRSTICRMVSETGETEEYVRKVLFEKYPSLETQMKRWEKQIQPMQFDEHAIKQVNLLLYNNRDIVKDTHNLKH